MSFLTFFKSFFLCLFFSAWAHTACATPTPVVNTIQWSAYSDANAKGFYIYWRDESLTAAAYSNSNRVQVVGTASVSDTLASVLPPVHVASLCFAMTAYDSSNNESAFSNEACGFTGFSSPAGTNLK